MRTTMTGNEACAYGAMLARVDVVAAYPITPQTHIVEDLGLNHAIWMWDPAWEPWTNEVNVMNYRFGQNSLNRKDELPNPLMDILQEYWQLNSLRPSDFYSD